MNSIAFVLGFGQAACPDDTAPRGVGFNCVSQCGGIGETEDVLQHSNDIVEGMFVVIEDDDVVKLFQLLPVYFFDFWNDGRSGRHFSLNTIFAEYYRIQGNPAAIPPPVTPLPLPASHPHE